MKKTKNNFLDMSCTVALFPIFHWLLIAVEREESGFLWVWLFPPTHGETRRVNMIYRHVYSFSYSIISPSFGCRGFCKRIFTRLCIGLLSHPTPLTPKIFFRLSFQVILGLSLGRFLPCLASIVFKRQSSILITWSNYRSCPFSII